MEPAVIEMNVPVGLAVVIGMIGFLSWALVKNFEKNLRVTYFVEPAVEETNEMDTSTDSADAPLADAPLADTNECEGDCSNCECTLAPSPVNNTGPSGTLCSNRASTPPLRGVGEVLDVDMEIESEGEVAADPLTQVHTDIDACHEQIEEINHKVETTHHLVTQMGESVIHMNDTTVTTLNDRISTLQTSFSKEFKALVDAQSALSDSLAESKIAIGGLLARPALPVGTEYLTANSLMNYATLDSVNFMKKMMQDEFRMSLAEFATLRGLGEVKSQIDDLLKRSTLQKNVYQAWNGVAKWTDFNEGELNIQMIRKKFMTTEQNEDWLQPENKKIASYNRDQLLGLGEDTWTSSDNTVFVKRYYKDDWDASVEVAITVTLSKKIMVPPGGKPEVTISHILRKLSEQEKITWEHLLVNV
jgi:hypothetical protein